MNETDRADIARHEGTLEREHLKYLTTEGADTEVTELVQNAEGVPVYFAKIEFSFGNLGVDRGPAEHLNQQAMFLKMSRG